MACFAGIDVSQGSVVTYATCDGIFLYLFNYKFTKVSPNEFFLNRLRFERIMVMSLWPRFFGPPCLIVHLKLSNLSRFRSGVCVHLGNAPYASSCH